MQTRAAITEGAGDLFALNYGRCVRIAEARLPSQYICDGERTVQQIISVGSSCQAIFQVIFILVRLYLTSAGKMCDLQPLLLGIGDQRRINLTTRSRYTVVAHAGSPQVSVTPLRRVLAWVSNRGDIAELIVSVSRSQPGIIRIAPPFCTGDIPHKRTCCGQIVVLILGVGCGGSSYIVCNGLLDDLAHDILRRVLRA